MDPLTTVATTSILGISFSDTSIISLVRITKSAYLPVSILPFEDSSKFE